MENRVTPSVTVTTTLDPTTPIAGQLSLREAINMVNAGRVADNTIILPAGTYQNAQGALSVTHSLILQGAGSGSTIIDGGGTDRVVLIDPTASVNVQISGVTIRDGNTTGGGGGIEVQNVVSQPSALTVQNCMITSNKAADGGGISDSGSGTLILTGSSLGNNTATGMGGGLFLGNPVLTATLQDSTLSGNTAGAFGGGIEDQAQKLTATNTILRNNVVVNGHGGGIDATNILNPTVTLTNVALVGNNAGGSSGQGGALFDGAVGGNDTLVSCLLADNMATVNGGGLQQDQGTLSVRDSQLSGNSSGGSGGGLAVMGNDVSFLVSDSTFNDNQTSGAGGALSFFANGGVSSLTNDTFTGNTAIADGGALALFAQGATLSLVNDTLNGNTAGSNGGGVSIETPASMYGFQNTIVAGNNAGGSGTDVFTATGLSVTDNGGNFIGTFSGSSGFSAGTLTGNPLLGSLQNNGGIVAGASGDQQVVQTEALLPGSSAIGKGDTNGAPITDERGFPRLTPPDIGAFQFQNVFLTITVTPATPSVLVNSMESFTITVANTGDNALPADNSTLAVILSAGLTTTGPLTFTLAAIPGGAIQTFTVSATATTLGTQTLMATVTSPDANPNSVSGNASGNVVMTPPSLPPPPATNHAPIGGLTLFAFGFGPTGIDLFEVDSAGDVFAVPFMGGGTPLLLNTSLHLPIAVLADNQLLALLAGSNGQDYLIDIVNPFNPFIEPTVLAALTHV